MGGGNQVGQISSQATGDASTLTGETISAMANRYQQLGLGATGAAPSGPTTGAVPGIPGSGTTPVTPGNFTGSSPQGIPGGPSTTPAATSGSPSGENGVTFGGAPSPTTVPLTAGNAGGGQQPGENGVVLGGGTASAPTGNTSTGSPNFASMMPGSPISGGPTAFEMESGQLPGWTSIPQEFQAALGEAQFQDLGQTAAAAAGSAQAKGQTFSGIGSALGGI